jgi:hypothetical protein
MQDLGNGCGTREIGGMPVGGASYSSGRPAFPAFARLDDLRRQQVHPQARPT